MNNIFIIGLIFIVSLILGFISYYASIRYDSEKDEERPYRNAPWQWKFFEVWNFFFNFFLAGLISYYFMSVRWGPISKGETVNVSDFILFFLFSMCIFRWFPYLIKNFTEGINVILKRVLERK